MKQILIALAILGTTYTGANAQSSKYDINYSICRIDGAYRPCGENMVKPKGCNLQVKDANNNEAEVASNLRKMDTYVHMGYSSDNGYNRRSYDVGNIHVSYDDPQGAYEGKETMINDGVQKNIERNINFYDDGTVVPPVDGWHD